MLAAMRISGVLLAIPVLLASGYLFVLALLSGRRGAPGYGPPRLRFDVVVPAHDEEPGVARTVRSLLAIDYPSELRRILVVADNCTDRTAEVAAAAGALVLERRSARRGKGYALEFAFERCLADGFADAIVVVDADSVASTNLLRAFSARLESGAVAVQACYGVRNKAASWRTRLMAIAFSLFHEVRSLGRERLRVSAGLRGNGMCFSTSLLREVPHRAYSLTEDLEYGIQLAIAGHRVHFASEVDVLSDMAVSARAARSQRQRWEGGRFAMLRQYGAALLWTGLRRSDLRLLDMAMDLFVPPLAILASLSGLGLVAAGLSCAWAGQTTSALYSWALANLLLAVYVLRGWQVSGTGLRGLADLLCAPAYAFWKATVLLRSPSRRAGDWVRTARETACAEARSQRIRLPPTNGDPTE
jgi:1,2-diacylglycerol 3-beta-glucosyltransferase